MRGGGEGGCRVSANENSCAHHVTWSPNKLWRSNSIFKLCEHRNDGKRFSTTARPVPVVAGVHVVSNISVVAGNATFAVAKSQQQKANNSTNASNSRDASQQQQGRQQGDSSHNKTPGMATGVGTTAKTTLTAAQ
jgi:hypothetical protein